MDSHHNSDDANGAVGMSDNHGGSNCSSSCCSNSSGGSNSCGGISDKSNCSYRNNNFTSCTPLLQETTTVADVVSSDCGVTDDWQLVQADFVDVPPGSDTSIRCVVQPPPDMLATHVCVEVGLVKSSAVDQDMSELPTIVVCSVDVEPCRQQPKGESVSEKPCTTERADGAGDDVLDRISQDLDYLLNRKSVDCTHADDPEGSPGGYGVDRKPKKQLQHGVAVQKRTKL